VPLGPTSTSRWAYAASKMVDEFLALAYAREFGLDVVVFGYSILSAPGRRATMAW
jgi:UDP-glucose 4-epimerase